MASFQDSKGNPVLPTVDAGGNVPVSLSDTGEDPSSPLETNRLLRKLIAGLELIHGQEFPEVE